jgi:hypothetical protein
LLAVEVLDRLKNPFLRPGAGFVRLRETSEGGFSIGGFAQPLLLKLAATVGKRGVAPLVGDFFSKRPAVERYLGVRVMWRWVYAVACLITLTNSKCEPSHPSSEVRSYIGKVIGQHGGEGGE